jgi:hypothetical protein
MFFNKILKGGNMPFEKFIMTGRSYRPKISIRTNGQIGFNLGAIKKFSLNKYKYAILFFDRENKQIGIKLTNTEEEGTCKLQVRKSNAAISGKAFLDYYSIDYSKTTRYEAVWNEKEKMIIATVK